MNVVLRLAWRNLWRHPRRTWLTLGAMVFSNVLLVFMISLQFGMYGLMIENTLKVLSGHLQVQAEGYIDDARIRQTVPDIEALAARIRRELELDAVAARAEAFALAASRDRTYGIRIVGVQPDREPGVSNLPGLVADGEFLADPGASRLYVGRVLARNLRVGVGDEVTLLGTGRDGSFAAAITTVAGIYDSGVIDLDRGLAELPLATFQEVFAMGDAGHRVVIVAPALGDVPRIKEALEALLEDRPGLVVHDWDRLEPGLRQAIAADISSAFFMYAVLVILVAFSVLNTQLMSVLERTREFGIVMALGVSPGRLGRLVMLETGLMGLMGLAAGVACGALFTLWFTLNGFSYPGMEELATNFNLPAEVFPALTPASVLIGPAVVFLFSLASALYPALRLNWLHPVEAMRAA